jgi:hypothetical protein
LIALLKYNYKVHQKYNKFIIPLSIFFVFQKIYYSGGGVDFISSMIICTNVVFCIMSWMGFSYCESQDSLTEQIVFLKVKNDKLYWISKVLFMWIIGIIVSLIGVIWPLVINLLNKGTLFKNEVPLNDILLVIFIQILVALMGILIGMIFQTKVIGSRNIAVLIITLSVLMSIVKGPLLNEFPIAKAIAWILPPIYDVINAAMKDGKISLSILIIPVIYSVGYILIQLFIYIKLMKNLLF